MPLLRIQTNTDIPKTLAQRGTELVVRELNKPIEYVQVIVDAHKPIIFGGTNEPCAFIELRSLDLSAEQATLMSKALTDLMKEELAISPERVFINFFDIDRAMWGWNGGTFA